MVFVANKVFEHHLVIMADYAEGYYWHRVKGADTPEEYRRAVRRVNFLSERLDRDLAEWQRQFECAPTHRWFNFVLMDWDSFHRQGIELARRLKQDVGDKARVFYSRPVEDPYMDEQEDVEVLSGGDLRVPDDWGAGVRNKRSFPIGKVISGGQSGIDRLALDWASQMGVPHGGWCPKGRRAIDGPIHPFYRLTETPASNYCQRTEWNVRDADATLIINDGALEGGTARTVRIVRSLNKPLLIIHLEQKLQRNRKILRRWLCDNRFPVLNVAGPSEASRPGIYERAYLLFKKEFRTGAIRGYLDTMRG